MRVCLDTNVLVSAFAARGLCADVMRCVLANHELIVPAIVLTELERALRTKLKLPGGHIADILAFLRDYRADPAPAPIPRLKIQDSNDRLIIASALATHAGILVTGDQELVALRSVNALRILSPRGFWAEVAKSA